MKTVLTHLHLAAYPSDAQVTSPLAEIFIRNVISVLQMIRKSIHENNVNTVTHTHTQTGPACTNLASDVHTHLLRMRMCLHTNML